MTVVSMEEAKQRIEELAHMVAGGEKVRIAVDTEVLVELHAVPQVFASGQKRIDGQWAGIVEISPDFCQPMPEEWLAAFYEGPIFPSEVSKTTEDAERRPE